MAERRMYAKQILASDAFWGLPRTTQLLYLYIALYADDEGLLNSPNMVMRMCGASEADLEALIANGYLIWFRTGVVAVSHWLIHNNIRKFLRKKSQNTTERAQLRVDPESKTYLLITDDRRTDNALVTLDEVDLNPSASTTDICESYGCYHNVHLSQADLAVLQKEYPLDYAARIDRLSTYMATSGKCYPNHLATIRQWAAQDAAKVPSTINPFAALAGADYDHD